MVLAMGRAATVLLPLAVAACLTSAASATSLKKAPACRSDGLSATFSRVPGSEGGGLVAYKLTLRNTSGPRCRLGFSHVRLLDRNGSRLPTSDMPETTSDLGPTVIVAPGQAAAQTARFSATFAGQGEPTKGLCENRAYSLQVVFGRKQQPLAAKVDPATPVCSKGLLLLSGISRTR
jgi:hypothetical protein